MSKNINFKGSKILLQSGLRQRDCSGQMRHLQKPSHYCGQFGLVHRFGWQKEHRRDFGTTRGRSEEGSSTGIGWDEQGGGGMRGKGAVNFPHIEVL